MVSSVNAVPDRESKQATVDTQHWVSEMGVFHLQDEPVAFVVTDHEHDPRTRAHDSDTAPRRAYSESGGVRAIPVASVLFSALCRTFRFRYHAVHGPPRALL
jgi:hypothetical protein